MLCIWSPVRLVLGALTLDFVVIIAHLCKLSNVDMGDDIGRVDSKC